MRRLLKILGALVGLIVLLVVAAVIMVPLVVDPNDYKDRITGAVKDATGRDLTIRGKIDLTVFPWLGVALNGVDLSNASGFGAAPFAAIESARVRVKLLPLLSKQVEVDKITLAGLELNLERAPDGRTNWDDLTPKAEAKPTGEEGKPAGPGLTGLRVSGIELRDARVSWNDRAAGERYTLDQLDLETGTLEPGAPVGLRLSVNLQSDAPKLKARLALAGTLEASPDMQRFSVKPMDLRLEDIEGEDGLSGSARLTGDLSFDIASGRLEMPAVAVDLDAQGGPAGEQGIRAQLRAALGVATQTAGLTLKGLDLTAGELRLTGDLDAQGLASDRPTLTGALRLADLDLRAWLRGRGMALPEMADDKALTRLALEADLGSRDGAIGIPRLVVVLDDSRLSGDLWVRNPKKPSYRFALDLDRLDLDRYLPPPSAPQQGAPAPGGEAPETDLFPVDALRALNLEGTLRIGELRVSGLKAGQVELKLSAGNGEVGVDDKVGKLYEGNAQGRIKLNAKGSVPELSANQQMHNMQAGPLVKDLLGEDLLEGTARLSADLHTRGNTVRALRTAMDGTSDFRFEDGAIKGVNLAKLIRDAQATLQGQPVSDTGEPLKTDFSLLEGQAVIKGNLVDNTALNMQSPLLRVSGAGTADIERSYLDYKTRITLVKSLEGQGGRTADQLTGVPIPVRYRGPFDGLSSFGNWSVDLQDVALEAGKQKLQEKLEERLFGGAAPGSGAGAETSGATAPAVAPKPREELKGLLKKRLGF